MLKIVVKGNAIKIVLSAFESHIFEILLQFNFQRRINKIIQKQKIIVSHTALPLSSFTMY